MTEADRRRASEAPRSAEQDRQQDERRAEEEAERRLGRGLAVGLPLATVVATLVVGFVASIPSALLVLASGALLGAVSLLWASVRTLSGDAPLPEDLELVAAQGEDVDGLAEQKRRVMRALKDLESEKAIGRIDAADHDAMASHYREEARALMKQMDERAAPAMAEAEKLAREYLADHAAALAPPPASAEKPAVPSAASRLACSACGASNEVDAAFCKQCGKGLARPEGSDATA